MTMTSKFCNKCKQTLPMNKFRKRPGTKDTYNKLCNDCLEYIKNPATRLKYKQNFVRELEKHRLISGKRLPKDLTENDVYVIKNMLLLVIEMKKHPDIIDIYARLVPIVRMEIGFIIQKYTNNTHQPEFPAKLRA